MSANMIEKLEKLEKIALAKAPKTVPQKTKFRPKYK